MGLHVEFLGEWVVPAEAARERERRKSETSDEVVTDTKGDPDMAALYLQRLLPLFCSTYHSTMVLSVR